MKETTTYCGPYNIESATISYKDNFEYRAAIRRVFRMDCDADVLKKENPDYDEETLDEELYDGEMSTQTLDFIFEETKNLPLFQKLYSLAAARIFSENLDLGMAIMFSYDLFQYFHVCLVKFFLTGGIDESDECVQVLLSKV